MKTVTEREMARVEGGILWIPILIGVFLVAAAYSAYKSGCTCSCS